MNKILTTLAAAMLLVACAGNNGMSKPATKNMSHTHMGHVLTSWKDTPNNKGLLPTARDEAEITVKHAELAVKKLSDLAWMKTHTKHVIHAVDPSKIETGPGLGYGVLQAANGITKHINLAATSRDASDNIKKHAVHVSTTANNTKTRAAEILEHAEQVLQSTSAEVAASHITMINDLAQQLIQGLDANDDGKISWHDGEGGIMVAEKHMGAMRKAEGI